MLAWITALVFLGGAVTVSAMETERVARAADATVSVADQATHCIAAHTFVARSQVVYRTWRSVDVHFATLGDALVPVAPALPFARAADLVAGRRATGPVLVGIVELRI